MSPLSVPPEAKVLEQFRPAFTAPTYDRFVVLCVAAIVAVRRRTVSRLLWAARWLSPGGRGGPGPLGPAGHFSSYHRVFSAARWALLPLGRVLAAVVLELVPAGRPVVLSGDDTVAQHRGEHVYGRGCHRDAVRSGTGRVVFKWGHKWVVLAVNVRLPFCTRAWALPVLAALCPPPPPDPPPPAAGKAPKKGKGKGKGKGRGKGKAGKKPRSRSRVLDLRKRDPATGKLPARHKTPALLMRQLVAVLIRWFPDRHFVLLGDQAFGTHDLALFCRRHRRHVTLVSRARPDAALYALPRPPTPKAGAGAGAGAGAAAAGGPARVRKGRRRPRPADAVAAAVPTGRRRAAVRWYGQSVRAVELVSACGGWYRGRGGGRAALVPVRWVYCKESKNGEEAWLFTTDPGLAPERVVELFAARWAVEVTFQEARAHLGFETTRQRCRASVLRAGPCLLGLFTVVALIYVRLAERGTVKVHTTPCYAKPDPTFADALAAVRRLLWERVLLPHAPGGDLVTNLPPPLRDMLLDQLTAIA